MPRNHGHNTTLVAALTPDGLLEPWLLIAGAMTSEACEWYIRDELAPQLQLGQVVVLDNLSAHKSPSLREALAARGCDLLFLPAYSPDFTPIEQAFSKVKAILRVSAPVPRRPSKKRSVWRSQPSLPMTRPPGSQTQDTLYLLKILESCSKHESERTKVHHRRVARATGP